MRRGHASSVHHWLDRYMRRLEEFPRGTGSIGANWREALGDPRRITDWTAHFRRAVISQPWRQVLEIWWPRLLPGLATATHGVIRTGHAVRALFHTNGRDLEACLVNSLGQATRLVPCVAGSRWSTLVAVGAVSAEGSGVGSGVIRRSWWSPRRAGEREADAMTRTKGVIRC